ncbi:MAG: pyrroline-5-carboxylate reductase [Firmicutes bacterium]|nr:pyrroline-5-carboxylate reductase [Bacillota bacterium]
MNQYAIGFIGAGNMGGALLAGIRAHKSELSVAVYDVSQAACEKAMGLGARVCSSIEEVVEQSRIVVVAVKPQFFNDVLPQVKDALHERKIIVSITPGFDFAYWHQALGDLAVMVRTVPNMPAMVGEGITLMTFEEQVSPSEKAEITALFECVGRVTLMPEKLLDAGMTGSSASPAFTYMYIEAMADGIVALGIPRAQAYELCAQAVLGAAKMVLETGLHPGVLKDQVCSPGGMTIQGVKALEENGFRYSVIAAEEAAWKKSQEMSKK